MARIHLTRSSVCAGDDCNDNSRDYEFDDDTPLDKMVFEIDKKGFFAFVNGNNVVWVMISESDEEVLSYHTLKRSITFYSPSRTLKDVCGASGTLHFSYYFTPEHYAADRQARQGPWGLAPIHGWFRRNHP